MARIIQFPRRSSGDRNREMIIEWAPDVYAALIRLANEEGINPSTVANRTVQLYDMIAHGDVSLGLRRWGIFWEAGELERPTPKPDDVG